MNSINDFTDIVHSQVCRSTDQVSTELQGEVVILNVKDGKYYNLNPVGSRIWQIIEHPVSAVSIVETIMDEYNVERQNCEQDVYTILLAMKASGLVDISAPAPDSASPASST